MVEQIRDILNARTIALALLAFLSRPLAGQGSTSEAHIEFLIGTAWSLPTPLTIRLPRRVSGAPAHTLFDSPVV